MATPDQVAQFKLDNWQHALAVAKQTGVDPRIVMAQAGVESDWGNAAPGNNVFGIKGPGQSLQTTEFMNGKLTPVTDSFSAYPSTAHSFSHYASLPIVQKVGQAGDYESQIKALSKSGYATDPNYASKVDKTAKSLTVPEGVQASMLPIYESKAIGAGAASNPAMAQTPPPPDTRTAGDADLAGYSGGGPQPAPVDPKLQGLLAAAQQRALAGTGSQAQGLIAQGAPQPSWTPMQGMLQIGRPRSPVATAPIIPGLRGLLG